MTLLGDLSWNIPLVLITLSKTNRQLLVKKCTCKLYALLHHCLRKYFLKLKFVIFHKFISVQCLKKVRFTDSRNLNRLHLTARAYLL